jgi:hypothetical protein
MRPQALSAIFPTLYLELLDVYVGGTEAATKHRSKEEWGECTCATPACTDLEQAGSAPS